MSDSTYTHKDLSTLLGVSETTIKSYRRKFPGCIPVASKGKPIRFSTDAVAVATRIRDLFENGMSVEEVKSRLCGEFDWIQEEDLDDEDSSSALPAKAGFPGPEISMGVSNMAKSMVAMTQQQKALMTRLESMETLLNRLTGGEVEALLKEKEQQLEARLSRLDAATQHLAGTVQTLVTELARFVQFQKKPDSAPAGDGETARTAPAKLKVAVTAPTPTPEQDGEKPGAKLLRLRPENGKSKDVGSKGDAAAEAVRTTGPAEPPRHFLNLPMVVRTEEGRYISAGGRGKGRFSINDLKAMLIYGFTPPNHFSLTWEAHGQGWWLYLDEEQGSRSFHLLLMELPTQRGGNVTEILQLKRNGHNLHPAEISAIIDSLSN